MNRLSGRHPRWRKLLLLVLGAGLAVSVAGCQRGAGAAGPVDSPGKQIPVTDFAACAGGDDTAQLAAALAALTSGDTLIFPAGVTCRHSQALVVSTPRVRLTGPGMVLATNEASSALRLDADSIVLDGGLTVAAAGVTRRWGTGEQMGVLLAPDRSGIVLRDIIVDGSAAAGVFVAGAADFVIDRVTVRNTMADGINITNGSHNGTLTDVTVTGAGDDGVAVVSYRDNQQVCHDLEIVNPTVTADRGGRGISVVGGRNVAFRNVHVESASAASVYIAQSSSDPGQPASWDTSSVDNVQILGGTLVNSNSSPAVANGAIVIGSSGPAGYGVSNVQLADLTVRGTRSTAPTEVGIYAYRGGSIEQVGLQNIDISDGPQKTFATNVPDGYSLTGWTVDGNPVPAQG